MITVLPFTYRTLTRYTFMVVGLGSSLAAPSGERREHMRHRLGIVVFQFDDGTLGHYTHAFRILEKYGLKGSFGVVTGILDRPGRLTMAHVKEMHEAGHEIHDHTLRHDAAFWGNPDNRQQWPARIEQSLRILRDIGIETRGWNQPGGKGQGWSEALRLELSKHYDYAAGRVGLRWEQTRNIHWHLKDDPLSLGRGGVCSWGYNGGKGDASKETECIKTLIADGIQQGLVTIPLWHRVKEEDGTARGLEETCELVRDNRLPTMVMADAVEAIQDPRDHFVRQVEQMPNPKFAYDIDANGRPDGYLRCRYAPAGAKGKANIRLAELGHGTTTWIYGPESGRTCFSLVARCASDTPVSITPLLTFTKIHSDLDYRRGKSKSCGPLSLGTEWQKLRFPVDVEDRVDRVQIELRVKPRHKILVSEASWRIVE